MPILITLKEAAPMMNFKNWKSVSRSIKRKDIPPSCVKRLGNGPKAPVRIILSAFQEWLSTPDKEIRVDPRRPHGNRI